MRLHRLLPIFVSVAALPQETVTFKAAANLVIVNVEIKGRDGKPVPGLQAADFEILENGKPQKLSVFEYQRLEAPPPAAAAPAVAVAVPAAAPAAANVISTSRPGELRYRDRRLIVLFFDLTSMGVPEQVRARRAAETYVNTRMAENDLLAIMAFSTQLKVLNDFTADRETLLASIKSLRVGEGSDLAEAGTTDEDSGAAFTADSSEFDIFNTDRKLTALENAVGMLASLPEKKALVYFSSGVSRTGAENESQLHSTINAAIRSNVAFYPVDARGLVAEAPAGDASVGNMSGNSLFSGRAQGQRRERSNAQQDTLYALAADTGGKAMFDSNDLAAGIVKAQTDFSSYYVLGFYTTNPAEDGRYRKVEVRLKSEEKLKLAYRSGYYAPKTFDKYTESDRERHLEEALRLGDPITDLPVALEVDYFRRARDRYIVPVAVKIPGSVIPTVRKKEKQEARLDFIAEIRDSRGRVAAMVRDFIRIQLTTEALGKLPSRLLQYDTAFTLPPGQYRLKFVVRENENGKLGTFETKFAIPDLSTENSWLRTSSVVWGSQRVPLQEAVGSAESRRNLTRSHPLVRDGLKLIPSITKVLRTGQELFVLVEVYEPGQTPQLTLDLQASLSFYNSKGKALESAPVSISAKSDPKAVSVSIELRVPLEKLAAGNYLCQLSVVDRIGRKFAFDRTPLVLLPPATP